MSETPKYAGCAKCGGAAACWCGQPRLDNLDHAQAREDVSWSHSMDARVWADKFAETLVNNPAIATDRDTMLGWFANAIMAGYDEAQRRALAASPQEGREECEKDLESLRADNLRLLMERVDILARAERAERELADAKREGAWEARTETYAHDCGCETCGDHTPVAPLPPVVTEEMVERYKAEKLAIAKERYSAPNGVILTDSQHDGVVRRLLTAALAERPRE
jgi:hypothetical protein